MKKALSVVLSLLMMISTLSAIPFEAFADELTSGKCGANVFYSYNESKKTLTLSGSGSMYDYDYMEPDKVSPFSHNSEVEKIVIESGITTIGDSAFYSMDIKNVSIPNTVTDIGDCAFFWNWNKFESVVVPESVKNIGIGAFNQCGHLNNITLPESIDHIGQYAFYNTGYTMNEDNCYNGGYYIGKYLVKVEEHYSGVINVKSGTALIADCLCDDYSYFDGISKIIFPDSVKCIGNKAFVYCHGLKNIVFGNALKTIGDGAFGDCSALTSINVPKSVKTIGDSAFPSYALEYISVESGSENYDSRNNCNAIIEKQTDTLILGCKNTVIPDSVKVIGKSAFSRVEKMTELELPDSITNIENWAFESTGLESIVIPDSVVNIGKSAFLYCHDLASVDLGKNVTTIGDYAFYDCENLESITIPNTVKNIGTQAFGFVFDRDKWQYVVKDKFTIYAMCDVDITAAENYAKENSVKYKIIHNPVTTKGVAATLDKNGKTDASKCSICLKTVNKSKTVYSPKTFILSSNSFAYDGKEKKPNVLIKDSQGNELVKDTDYSVKYSNSKNVGTATVNVTFIGNYSGTKKLTFKINPKATTLLSASAKSKGFTVKWKKQATQTTGYEIQYSTSKSFKSGNKTVTVSKNSTTSKTINKLKSKKKYYVHIRTYKSVKGKKYYSAWSKSKTVTTKK